MDPFTFAVICVVAFGMVGGFDAASDGLVRAEVGSGVRGAAGYVARAERARWSRARTKAREIRQQTPQGRAVQGFLDTAGLFARAFGSEVWSLGSGVVRGWRSGRVRAKQARQERMAGEPWPLVRVCGPLMDRAKQWAQERPRSGSGHPNGVPNEPEPNDPNGASSRPWWDPNATTEPTPNETPNGDPNVPHDSHLPDANGDVKCGCCAQLHKPTPRGEHCPNCHLHDGPTTPNAPAQAGPTRGTTVPDINSAPAAIAAAEAFRGRLEEPESLLASLRDEITSTLDGMGDFAIGGEGDTSGRFGVVVDAVTSAKEGLDVYLADLHREYDASIEAASSKQAAAHAPMQEV